MNKNAIQKYAIWARNELIEQIKQRAYQYGVREKNYDEAHNVFIAGRVLTETERRQQQDFVKYTARVGYEQAIEEVAYTWFNRFVALRYMEVNDYLPTHIRVFSDANGAFNPEILKDVLHLDLPGLDKMKVSEFINANATDDLYRYLLLTQCNALNEALPEMFERMGGYSEILLPNNILRQDGVLERLVNWIPEEDWRDTVQIIGWMYQYYNTEPKQAVFDGLKKNVKITKEKIPAATQLFTPDWIVRYMVENSLGRLWLEGHPDNDLINSWKYYLSDAEQTPEVEAEIDKIRRTTRNIKPEDIKVIDPCMGSGHILVYAFDVLIQIYRTAGYADRDAAKLILEKNLYGLDIDRRAYQLAYFSLMMKARQYNRRIFTQGVELNLCEIIESSDLRGEYKYTLDMGNFLLNKAHRKTVDYLMDAFAESKEYGSLTKVESRDYDGLLEAWNTTASATAGNVNLVLWQDAMDRLIPKYIKQAKLLTQKYDVVVTNPPYMGSGGMGGRLSQFVKDYYPDSKSDLFAVFIEKCGELMKPAGLQAMITQHAWMFLSSFEKLRGRIIRRDIVNMAHLGARAFAEIGGEVVQSTAFVMRGKYTGNYKGSYVRLVDIDDADEKEREFLSGNRRYIASTNTFSKVQGNPLAYWASEKLLDSFEVGKRLNTITDVKSGLSTTNNELFLRFWFEVSLTRINFITNGIEETVGLHHKWFPLVKGGSFRKWYGNTEYVVNWEENGRDIREVTRGAVGGRIVNPEFYFKKIITWSALSSSEPSMRISQNAIFGSGAKAIFPTSNYNGYIAFLNSKIALRMLQMLSPTLNYETGHIGALPVLPFNDAHIKPIVDDCIRISREDWDSYETSWDFDKHPLI